MTPKKTVQAGTVEVFNQLRDKKSDTVSAKAIRKDLHHICGLKRKSRIFEGTSNSTYGAKKQTRAELYCVPVSLRSFARPKTTAAPMFVLARALVSSIILVFYEEPS